MVVFTDLYNQDQKILDNFRQQKLLVPYVLVKDGTLFPSKITASSYFADAVSNYFNRGDIFVIGVIKNSRFINKENAWAKVIATYAAEVKHNTFFRLPKAVELSIDRESDKHLYHRYFLSLYGGEAIFEIQVPQLLSQDDLKRKQIFDGLAAQVTLMYGGSVSTNSYAHQEASLPESEARFLTDQLREDLRTTESEETADE